MKKSLLISLLLLLVLCFPAKAGIPTLERLVTLNFNNTRVEEVLNSISQQAGFTFSYSTNVISGVKPVTIKCYQRPVRWVLSTIFGSNYTYKERGKYIILLKDENAEKPKKNIIIEGYITESTSGKNLGNVTVYDRNNLNSALTNEYGYFKMILPVSDSAAQLVVSKSGYAPVPIKPVKQDNQLMTIELAGQIIDSTLSKNFKDLPDLRMLNNLKINSLNVKETVFKTVNISLLPFIGTNKLLSGSVSNNLSFNATVGFVHEIKVAEFGGLMNIVVADARYCQAAGLGNFVGGNVEGFQGAGVFNVAKNSKGCQASGALNFVESAEGAQLAGIANINKGKADVQFSGLLNIANGDSKVQGSGLLNVSKNSFCQMSGLVNLGNEIRGTQVSGFINVAQKTDGVQVSGFTNIVADSANIQVTGFSNHAKVVEGTQLSGFMNTSGKVKGAQVTSFLNIAKEVDGAQVSGFMNITKNVKGCQIGVFNFADSCNGVSVGLISIVRKGYHKLDVSANEITLVNFAFRTGVNKFFTIISVGIKPSDFSSPLWTYGYGIGTLIPKNERLAFELNLEMQDLIKNADFEVQNKVYKVYFGIDRRIFRKSSIAAGLSYNFLVTDTKGANYNSVFSKLAPYSLSNNTSANGTNLKTYISGKLAFRF